MNFKLHIGAEEIISKEGMWGELINHFKEGWVVLKFRDWWVDDVDPFICIGDPWSGWFFCKIRYAWPNDNKFIL